MNWAGLCGESHGRGESALLYTKGGKSAGGRGHFAKARFSRSGRKCDSNRGVRRILWVFEGGLRKSAQRARALWFWRLGGLSKRIICLLLYRQIEEHRL